jgi:DNA-binding MarR family transcriptional regulator
VNAIDLQFLGRALSELAVYAIAPAAPDEMLATAAAVQPAEAAVLGRLLQEPGLTVGELVRLTLFTQGRVSAVVAGFRERGWVETQADPTDRRRTRVWPTAEVIGGSEKAFSTSAEEALGDLLEPLSRRDKHAVLRGLALLLERLGDEPHYRSRLEDAGVRHSGASLRPSRERL